jgi:hypothetical protein
VLTSCSETGAAGFDPTKPFSIDPNIFNDPQIKAAMEQMSRGLGTTVTQGKYLCSGSLRAYIRRVVLRAIQVAPILITRAFTSHSKSYLFFLRGVARTFRLLRSPALPALSFTNGRLSREPPVRARTYTRAIHTKNLPLQLNMQVLLKAWFFWTNLVSVSL